MTALAPAPWHQAGLGPGGGLQAGLGWAQLQRSRPRVANQGPRQHRGREAALTTHILANILSCVVSAECGGVSHLKYQETSPLFILPLPQLPPLSHCLSAPVSVRGKTTAAAAALPTLLPWPPATAPWLR